MSGSVNKVILLGRLGADPETRRMGNGDPVVNLRVATSETWKDKQTGEKRERTEWHRVVIFNKGLANVADQWLVKGSQVYLEGHLQTRKWQDQSGQDRYSTEIVLSPFNGTLTLIGGNNKNGNSGKQQPKNSAPQQQSEFGSAGSSPDTDDEIPF